ncbi:MAG: site-2 protease family protein [Candidatus Limnocylindria bacterium]
MLFFDFTAAQIAGIVVALVIGITFHEFSHALIADALGDHRPRAMGRVSLNPAAHIDPVGALVFLVAGFGWGRPVMVNVYALRPGRIGMAMVAAGGPVANLLVATVAAIGARILDIAGIEGLAREISIWIVYYNVLLAIFNLIPIPPLDGYNALLAFLPPRAAFAVQRYAPYGIIVLLVLILLPNSPLQLLLGLASPVTRALVGA